MLNLVLVNQQQSNVEMAAMQWLWSIFLAGFYLNFYAQGGPIREMQIADFLLTGQGNLRDETRHLLIHKEETSDKSKKRIIDSDGKLMSSEEGDDFLGDEDFVDEDEDLMNLGESEVRNTLPVTHLHREKGEILVPCFGMWWPVGGVYYDYGDYYGDYRKKRRARKQKKKAAKMKKKKA